MAILRVGHLEAGTFWMDGWMEERCFRRLFRTIKAELGRGQPGRDVVEMVHSDWQPNGRYND